MTTIFKDLTIVELASVLAGPAVGMFFAELGAKVIKIENATTNGDVTRTWKIKGEQKNGSAAYYHSVNYNKEIVFLNLKEVEGQKICEEIISKADVLISNFSDQVSHNFGLAYAQIKERHPSLIYAQLFGFESDRSRAAYDIVLQAESGFLSMSGSSDGILSRMPVALIDILAAHQLKEGILCALIRKMKTSKGCLISTSLEESAISSLANQATNYLMVNHIPKPMGTSHPNIAPYGDIFLSSDQVKLVLAIGSDNQFSKLVTILGKSELATHSAYYTNNLRVENRENLMHELSALIQLWNADELIILCNKAKVPIGKVQNLKDVFQSKIGQSMVLEQTEQDGSISKRVRTVAFRMKENET